MSAPPATTETPIERRDRLIRIFHRLRWRGVTVGNGELLDLFRAIDGHFCDDPSALKRTAALIWCRNASESAELDAVWDDARTSTAFAPREPLSPPVDPGTKTTEPVVRPVTPPVWERTYSDPATTGTSDAPSWLGSVPFRAPAPLDIEGNERDLLADRPISRRQMIYAWRYLHRPLPDGPADVLDVDATINRFARQGLLFAPVYRRRPRNLAHLVLFVDQNGSMAPFHRFSRDLIETACHESAIHRVDVFYFHDQPATPSPGRSLTLFDDPFLTVATDWRGLASSVSPETAALIVSDAGAARGRNDSARSHLTARFLNRLRRLTPLVAWLNPMPADRWPGTTAELIAHLIPMFPMTPDGLGQAIERIRGLTPLNTNH
jgi:uncharacterized protein